MTNPYLGYNFTSCIAGNFIPQRIQNLCIRDYAKSKGLPLAFSVAEYWDSQMALMLFTQLHRLDQLAGLVFYSFLLLPENPNRRKEVYQLILASRKKIYFALEDLVLEDELSRATIERMYAISTDSRLNRTRFQLIENKKNELHHRS